MQYEGTVYRPPSRRTASSRERRAGRPVSPSRYAIDVASFLPLGTGELAESIGQRQVVFDASPAELITAALGSSAIGTKAPPNENAREDTKSLSK